MKKKIGVALLIICVVAGIFSAKYYVNAKGATTRKITLNNFCTSGGSGIDTASKHLKAKAKKAKKAKWLSGKRFEADVSESDIQDWIKGLGK